MATSTVPAALGDERNGSGLEPNGHVSPANSQPDSTNTQKALTSSSDAAPVQDQLSNKDAFTLNQSVSAMTPPAAEAAAATEDSPKKGAPEPSDVKDTEMIDAPAESATKPPSPPAEPAAEMPAAPPEQAADSVKPAEPSPKPALSPLNVETSQNTDNAVKPELDVDGSQEKSGSAETRPEDAVEAIDAQKTAVTGTPTTSMSKMALEGDSQESAVEGSAADTNMPDAPSQSSAKVAREREEDEDGEPAAKRARTSGEGEAAPASETAVAPESGATAVEQNEKSSTPAPATVPASASAPAPASAPASASASEPRPAANGSPAPLSINGRARMLTDSALENNPITSFQNKEIRKVLGLIKKTKAGANFKSSVQVLWPGLWEQYRSLISRPVDISSIEQRLRDTKYTSLGQLKKDVRLIEENAVTFNGMNHDVSKWAQNTVEQIFQRLALIPAEEPAKPVKQEVKQSSRHTELRKPAPVPPKKEARPVASVPADKTNDSQTDRYALLPSGMPNIRRDSTKTDADRPKRPIHPPKNRDIGFPAKTARNKKKPELKFCEEVIKELMAPKNWAANQWFLEPVDPVALNIPNYHSVVKQPMDLGTMRSKLEHGEYESAKDFKSDFGLIVRNCVKFNTENNPVTATVRELEKMFEKKWSEKASWISKHAPPSAPLASATSPRGGIKDETDDEEASDAEQQGGSSAAHKEIERALETLTSRVRSEQAELDNKLNSATPDMSAIDVQRGILAHLQNLMVSKRLELAKLGEPSKAPPKVSKKKTSGAAGASGPSKKAVGATQGVSKKATGGATAAKKPVKKKLTDEEKEIVSEGISRLEDVAMDKAITIIKKDTGLKSEDDELELDMDQLSDGALVKLLELVLSRFPEYKEQIKRQEPVAAPAHSSASKGAAKAKKNKPMGKAEQERKLEQLRELKAAYKRPGSGSQEPLPSVENNDAVTPGQQHQDSDDASSSEEE
ncbi:unnamed protein product [Discula destructiva]